MNNSTNISVSFLFLIILTLMIYLFFFSHIRQDKNIRIIEKPIYGKNIKNEKYHRPKIYCDDFCEEEICNEYKQQLSYYKKCKECSNLNMCWNLNNTNCHICENGETSNCESTDNYGCWNPELNKYTAPLNPKLTGCNRCWKYKNNI